MKRFAEDIRRYHLTTVTGDAYAGEWPRDEFSDNGVAYIVSDRDEHDIYKDTLPRGGRSSTIRRGEATT